MALVFFRDFLESSTIHGLVHISTAKSKTLKALWVAIVVACFAIAIHMINDSYNEWQESPVSTTITTHPITDLEFPTVTVCPPRGSNTALNHLLGKVKDVNFTNEERQELLDISKEVLLEIPNKIYAKEMTALLSTDHIRSIANGHASMPTVDDDGIIILRSSEPQGSFSLPSDSFRACNSLKFELNLPTNFGELVGESELTISVATKGNWSFFAPRNEPLLVKEKMNMSAAEDYCVSRGGHLASVGSQREQTEIYVAWRRQGGSPPKWSRTRVWLGGRRKAGNDGWGWLVGSTWSYQHWFIKEPSNDRLPPKPFF